MADLKREELILAAQAEDAAQFIIRITELRTQVEMSVSDIISSMSKRQIDDLWSALHEQCSNSLLVLEQDHVQEEIQEDRIEETNQVLTMTAVLGLDTIQQNQIYVPQSLLDSTLLMNQIMNSLPECMTSSQAAIEDLCEVWYHSNLQGRHLLSLELFISLLTTSLQTEPTASLLKRVWDLHEVLLDMDLMTWSDEHSNLPHLLLQCVIKPAYLKNDKGRKLISVLFGLGGDMVNLLQKSIKQVLPSAPQSLLSWYGEVYFKAWWASTGPLRDRIEEDCIQDLMYHAVYASRKGRPNMAKSLRYLLNYFHKKKRQPGVDDMLLRLYQPILWRSLKVANGNVRANAASLLLDAFPLKGDNMGVADQDELVQRQIDVLQELLFDKCPLVRAICVHGICRLCALYWEMFPGHVLRQFVQKLVENLAWDGGSADVRLAVFQGLSVLVDQPLSHPVLKLALPLLKNHLRDQSEKVRIGFINLLIKLKSVRTIKIWSIVKMEELLDRLSDDSTPVSRRIVHLIGPSFLPDHKPVQVQLSRCVALVDMNGMAARRFYQLIPRRTPVRTIAHLMARICRSLLILVDREMADQTMDQTLNMTSLIDPHGPNTAPGPNFTQNPSMIEALEDDGSISLDDENIIIGLFEVAAIMWTVIKPALAIRTNADMNKALIGRYAAALPIFFKTFTDARIVSALYVIAGYIPANHLNMFSKSCLSRLKSMTSQSASDDYSRIVQMMCQWNRLDDVIELVSDWLNDVLDVRMDKTTVEVPRRKSVSFLVTCQPQPDLALCYLDAILDRTVSRDLVFNNHQTELRILGDLVAKVKRCIDAHLLESDTDGLDDKCSRQLMKHALTVYIKLIALFAGKDEEVNLEQMKSFVRWMEEVAAKCQSLNEDKKEFAHQILERSLEIINDMLLVGLCDAPITRSLSNIIITIMTSQPTLSIFIVSMDTMHCIAEVTSQLGDVGGGNDVIPELMTSLMVTMTGLVRNDTDSGEKLLVECKGSLYETLCSYYQSRDNKPRDRAHQSEHGKSNDVMSTMVSLVLTEMTRYIEQNGVEDVDKFCDLPILSSHVLEILCKRTSLSRMFVRELEGLCSVGGILEGVYMLVAVHQILCLIDKVSPKTGGVDECMTSLMTSVDRCNKPDKQTDFTISTIYEDLLCKLRARVIPNSGAQE